MFRLLCFLLFSFALLAAEHDAASIEATLRERHLPFGTILDPEFENGAIVNYHRCGDSALWTAHYLAAQAFEYRVTKAPETKARLVETIDALGSLVEVTGTGLLARCAVPVDSPYAAGILSEESNNGSYTGVWRGREYHWVGNTSRDQYIGFFYGLGITYSLIEDTSVRDRISAIVTRALDFVLAHDWLITMPDGRISTLFAHRPDQQLMLLAVGRHVNPKKYDSKYRLSRLFGAASVIVPIAAETLDPHNSYYKFNLDELVLYTLLRLDSTEPYHSYYREAYDILRRTLDDHGNAQFNMLDHALFGPEAKRDAETRRLLEDWLTRPRTDEWVDLRGVYPACEQDDRSCTTIPVPQRVRTDYLWQRSPFLLYGGGSGRVEGAGIDYLLPYWMGRFYGVLE